VGRRWFIFLFLPSFLGSGICSCFLKSVDCDHQIFSFSHIFHSTAESVISFYFFLLSPLQNTIPSTSLCHPPLFIPSFATTLGVFVIDMYFFLCHLVRRCSAFRLWLSGYGFLSMGFGIHLLLFLPKAFAVYDFVLSCGLLYE